MSDLVAAAAPIAYPPSQAFADLAQIAAIVAVTITLLVAMVADLMLPSRLRGPVVAVLTALGLLAAVAIAGYRGLNGGGGPAYFAFATGDRFALFFEVLFGILGILTVAISHSYLRRRGFLEAEFHILTLAAVIGMMVLGSATSLVTVFLGLELLSIALYIASGFARSDTASQESAAKYLLVGGFASAFVLYGMALVYGATGSTVLSVIAQRVTHDVASNPILWMGVLLMGVGFAFKVSGAPFHMWTPDVYQGAPVPVTAFMSVGTKAAAFAMIVRVFSGGLPHLGAEWQALLAFVAAASLIVGNLMAIAQSSVKRLLAYSSVAQGGYVMIGVVSANRSGIAAVLFYLFAYMFMNFGAFAVLSSLAGPEGEHDRFADLDGLAYRDPLRGVLMTVFMFSLAGFPLTAGFMGKFFLFAAGVSAGYTWLVLLAALASVVSVYYYFRVVRHVWARPQAGAASLDLQLGPSAAILFSGLLVLALGLYPSVLLYFGQAGADPVLAMGSP